jgi:RNA polymerase primary sigma factor
MNYDAALALQQLMTLGQKRGFLTYAQVNERLPASVVDPLEIESIVEQLERFGVRVVENSASKES